MAEAPAPHPLATVFAYHERTKHHPHRFARALGYLDWDTQPDPFRRYEGAETVPLEEVPPTPEPRYEELYAGRLPPRPVDRAAVAQLFYDSLALSAWKEYRGSRWSLRVNPSSGNLHPTEGYLLAGAVPGLPDAPALWHYAPYLHALERRAPLDPAALPADLLLVGLSSIHWREAWKYGERAFRYSMHDAGHAIAAVALAAAALGWEARLLDPLPDDGLARLLGIADPAGPEAEHADALLALHPRGWPGRPEDAVERLLHDPPRELAGRPNRLSADHHDWPVIAAVADATRCDGAGAHEPFAPAPRAAPEDGRPVSARTIVRQRRSAVDLDGRTSLPADAFFRTLERVLPAAGRPPLAALTWRPAIHLVLFVHRVNGLEPGLYALVRHPDALEPLREAFDPRYAWSRPPAAPESLPLFLLRAGDWRDTAQLSSCTQAIASEGAFAVAMLAEFEPRLRAHGPWFYRRLHWEAGAIGQVLYLDAEAAGVRGTGIGCFFDDTVHDVLGLGDRRFQDLYHFTIGGPVDDPRLQTHPAYAHRG
jgi:SagB-type dehydrogenase family enzyme